MNIAIFTDSIREHSTGIGFYTKDVVTELLKVDKKNNYLFLDFLKTEFNKNRLIKIPNPFKYFKTYFWHNYIPFKTRAIDVDLLFNFSAVPHLFPFLQKEIFFVYDISWYLYPEYHPISRVFFYKFFFKRCLMNCYKIVVDSISTKDDLIKFFHIPAKKISIIYPSLPGITPSKNILKDKIDFPYMLFIGTLEPRKNILSIINAYNKLKTEKNIKQKLIICGKKGWLYNAIFDLIKSLNLENDIVYFGYITDEEKKYLFKHADLFVYPSYYEGFGIPILESFSYGCPVITSNLSSLPEVVGKAGIQVDPNNVDQLATAMNRLLTDEKLKIKLKKEGYKQVKNLSNKKQIKSLLQSLY